MGCVLSDYRLRFNMRSKKDGSGKANAVYKVGSALWGVLYSIPDEDLPRLDIGEEGYRRIEKEVHSGKASLGRAWVYVAKTPSAGTIRPYEWYKRFLVEGAREHGLPADTLQALEAIEAERDPDAERDRNRRTLKCEESG